jgi:hypothetical protein
VAITAEKGQNLYRRGNNLMAAPVPISLREMTGFMIQMFRLHKSPASFVKRAFIKNFQIGL